MMTMFIIINNCYEDFDFITDTKSNLFSIAIKSKRLKQKTKPNETEYTKELCDSIQTIKTEIEWRIKQKKTSKNNLTKECQVNHQSRCIQNRPVILLLCFHPST